MAVKLNTNTSIVDYLKSKGQDSSFENRKKLAKQYGITDYKGLGDQNTALLNTLKTGNKPKVQQTTVTKKVQNVPKAVSTQVEPVTPKDTVQPATAEITQTVEPQTLKASSEESPSVEPPLYEQNAPEAYQSPYSSQIDTLLNNILNRQPFSFDLNSDPLYKVYEEQYTQGANKGMRDTMGNAAALTGGYGSSYAGVAGQQTYDNYMSQLNDVVPELYNAALQKYQSGINNDLNNLQALQALENNSYGQYRDTVGDWQADRSYYYGKDYDTQQQQNWKDTFDYGKTRDTVSDQQWKDTFDYGKQYDQQQQENWQDTFDYGKENDKQQQDNWDKQFNYNAGQDKQAQENYEEERNYNKLINDRDYNYRVQQDKDAMDKYLEEIEANESKEQAKQSEERINKYTKSINEILSSTTEDEMGNKTQKYSLDDAWNYLMESGLSDDEIAVIINDNYELRKYAENITGKGVTDNGRSYSYGGRNY